MKVTRHDTFDRAFNTELALTRTRQWIEVCLYCKLRIISSYTIISAPSRFLTGMYSIYFVGELMFAKFPNVLWSINCFTRISVSLYVYARLRALGVL